MRAKILFVSILYFYASNFAIAGSGVDNKSVQVKGNLVASTCSINGIAKGSTANVPVDLGTVSTSSFNVAGKVGGVIIPVINFTGCPANSNIYITLDGTGAINATNMSYVNTTILAFGGTQNMEVQIINTANGSVLDPSGSNFATVQADSSGAATSTLGVRFRSSGVATAGIFSAIAGFNVTYP